MIVSCNFKSAMISSHCFGLLSNLSLKNWFSVKKNVTKFGKIKI